MATRTHKTWQEELLAECRRRRLPAPVYNVLSDRRGGRTAWSATVTLSGCGANNQDWNIAARYWYDGQYIHNAKEDAAEVMISEMRNPALIGHGTQATQPTQDSQRDRGTNGGRWGTR